MRPPGEVRQALLQAVAQAPAPGLLCLRELAARAGVGLDAARVTCKNLTRAGALAIRGQQRMAHRNRPVALYGLPDAALAPQAGAALAHVLQAWR